MSVIRDFIKLEKQKKEIWRIMKQMKKKHRVCVKKISATNVIHRLIFLNAVTSVKMNVAKTKNATL